MQGVKRFTYASRPRQNGSGYEMMQLSRDLTQIRVTLRISNLCDMIHGHEVF
jgi:hypothetical protein